jgi:hypothetical protein
VKYTNTFRMFRFLRIAPIAAAVAVIATVAISHLPLPPPIQATETAATAPISFAADAPA